MRSPRLNGGLMVMVIALALVVLVSFAAFSRDNGRAANWQSLPGSRDVADVL
jgi:hypothetical protein